MFDWSDTANSRLLQVCLFVLGFLILCILCVLFVRARWSRRTIVSSLSASHEGLERGLIPDAAGVTARGAPRDFESIAREAEARGRIRAADFGRSVAEWSRWLAARQLQQGPVQLEEGEGGEIGDGPEPPECGGISGAFRRQGERETAVGLQHHGGMRAPAYAGVGLGAGGAVPLPTGSDEEASSLCVSSSQGGSSAPRSSWAAPATDSLQGPPSARGDGHAGASADLQSRGSVRFPHLRRSPALVSHRSPKSKFRRSSSECVSGGHPDAFRRQFENAPFLQPLLSESMGHGVGLPNVRFPGPAPAACGDWSWRAREEVSRQGEPGWSQGSAVGVGSPHSRRGGRGGEAGGYLRGERGRSLGGRGARGEGGGLRVNVTREKDKSKSKVKRGSGVDPRRARETEEEAGEEEVVSCPSSLSFSSGSSLSPAGEGRERGGLSLWGSVSLADSQTAAVEADMGVRNTNGPKRAPREVQRERRDPVRGFRLPGTEAPQEAQTERDGHDRGAEADRVGLSDSDSEAQGFSSDHAQHGIVMSGGRVRQDDSEFESVQSEPE
uniref:Transmembrane protein n=1 Tax=Chromera velia CCMP2878 TaxID=1169474 RepID=A0A0G4F051_9ALVE|eukprot:Cvel_14302.t1-p1 / transcript=Cvel_14302.t1 / gene=Cvel_14302 / organism=Chromera_velia_CCMP2878 / gene_product=hypothetical protein / transcript_product=hypothetical protein / location=Cvel_scaffold1011:7232-8890(+) / protein_length=553 / sequence_SO=supercontig / SO=protein_coding / is_pseudo=false